MSKTVTILVPLDVILDTRIATVALMDEDKAVEILKNGYHKRRSDFFKGIDKKEFDERYKRRNEETLSRAQCTNIIYVLRDMVKLLIHQAMTTPYHNKVKLVINLYPYQLNKDTADIILAAISKWMIDLCEIESIYIRDEDLTPDFIKGRYDILFMYHYAHWLEQNTENFKKTSINDCNLYVPAISFETDLTDEMINKIKKESMHPLDAIKLLAAPFINIEPIDVSAFSVMEIKK